MGSEDEDFEDEEDDGAGYPEELSVDSEEEKEDYTIRKSDALIVAATAESDFSNLEVYLYDESTSDLYVHHDLMLSAYPLCLEWIPKWGGRKANFVAVGTFLPEIEIWNLDILDAIEPDLVLGNAKEAKKPLKNLKKKLKPSADSHSDSVMSLSLNPFQQEYLASGSADSTVKIWDISEARCVLTMDSLHQDKVQVTKWSLLNEQVLLTGGYDRVIRVVDVKSQDGVKFKAQADIECGVWSPVSEHHFCVSFEDGSF